MIIDDDEAILDALSLMFRSERYEVIIDAGDKVMTKIRKHNPNVIILDILLSGKDGREICKKVRDKVSKKTLIILFSAHPGILSNYKEWGADAFLPKPFDNDTLLAIIRNHFKKLQS